MTALRRLALATAIGAAVAGSIYATRAHSQSPLEILMRANQAETASPDGKSRTRKHGVVIPRFIRGRLVCARNVVAFHKANGIRTLNTARARDFLHWGRAVSSPVRLGVAVYRRGKSGGHVKIVLGNGRCLNPSSRAQAWREVPCRVAGLIGYRAP